MALKNLNSSTLLILEKERSSATMKFGDIVSLLQLEWAGVLLLASCGQKMEIFC